jgi:hypothetical protein
MKKLGLIAAAVAAIAIAAPSVASAEKIIIKRGGDHHYGPRAEFRGHGDRGWHRGHDRKVVIIKHGRDRRY